jgi:PTS system D-glucosamine-specific IIC component
MSGKFPLMIFGLPGAALAMYKCAKPEKQKTVGTLLLSAALTSMLTGITEPLEFTFLFVAPLLYGIHCIFAGLAYMLMHIFNVGVGMTFSGGLIDLFLFGILPGNAKTNWIWVIIIGVVYFIVYYFLFTLLITKLNLKTPGREADDEETKLYTRADVNAKNSKNTDNSVDEISALITQGLGGKDNISDVDCCATRLRITVNNPKLVDESKLKASGASGVIHKGNGVQVIYGPRVTVIKSNLEDYLSSSMNDNTEIILTNTKFEQKIDKIKHINSTVFSPMQGKVVNLAKINDGVFSEGMLGKGVAIEPTDGIVVSPFDGEVQMIYDTKHAIGLMSTDGVELLIHVGIDTVQLKGKYFDIRVENGQKIKKGDILMKADLNGIQKEGYRIVTPVIVTNTEDFTNVTPITDTNGKSGEKIIEIG